ncbi:metallophosphoesterase family protein [Leisingera sp. MMG026]|uniref:metallophosphoesterase family protein n=1 Tax=Leisingera sp. MMG026 TaxID=2909982 RepID=UPI001F327A90|nr:metallophosphoesterase family protein [Leisingera sp. MMG026]MCF6430868.1 metallophosphoesterase family protein [Leisingera sp. MMG026]
MKILAFSDLHLSSSHAVEIVAASAGADLVIGAGDFCNMRQGLDRAVAMLAGLKAPMVAVPGNGESAGELRAAEFPGTTVLHGEGVDFEGLRLFGLGYGVPETPFGSWSCDLSEVQAAAMLAACDHADILISHSPPKGLGDVTSGGLSVGSMAVRAAAERIRPQLLLCGHVHDCWGFRGSIGRTRVANLGPLVSWFEVQP